MMERLAYSKESKNVKNTVNGLTAIVLFNRCFFLFNKNALYKYFPNQISKHT